jgi:hypothetical protein
MAIDPRPNISPPTARQQAIVQSNDPVRELNLDMPQQSLTTSRVLVVVFSTVSGGTRSHIPNSGVWTQISLGGSGGFVQFGNILVSAWLSRAGSQVYSGGLFRFAGLVGLAPEHGTIVAVELTDMQNGSISLAGHSWDESYENAISGTAAATGNYARGVLAVGVAEGQHHFLAPTTGQQLLTQTAVSGFFSAPFSAVAAYKGQTSNDPLPVNLPFDSVASRNGLLLFNALNEASSINSPEGTFSTGSLISAPQNTITTDSFIRNGGEVTNTVSAYVEFPEMFSFASTSSALSGETLAIFDTESNIYNRVAVAGTTDAYTDEYHVVSEEVVVELVGTVTSTDTTSSVIVNSRDDSSTGDSAIGKDLFHLTDSYIFSGQTSHTADSLLQSEVEDTHVTDAALVTLQELTHFTNSYKEAMVPPTETHTTSGTLLTDNILGMMGWELQDTQLECSYVSPDYSVSTEQLLVTTLAVRPGSLGAYGMRIVNSGALATDQYVLPKTDLLSMPAPGEDGGSTPGAHYKELWTTLHFRVNTVPTDWEQLIGDIKQQQLFPPNTLADGFSYFLAIRAMTGGFQLGFGVSSSTQAVGSATIINFLPLALSNWYKLEIRLYTEAATLEDSSPTAPFYVQLWLNGQPIELGATFTSYLKCYAAQAIGIQQRAGVTDYSVDFDDFVISTNRLDAYDLSVIALPAKADGTYSAWTGVPADDYTDVESIPYDPAKYQQASADSQKFSIKVYEGGDSDPYPSTIHAVSFHASSSSPASPTNNTEMFLRKGATEVVLREFNSFIVNDLSVLTVRSPVDELLWADSLYDTEFGLRQIGVSSFTKINLMAATMLVSPPLQFHYTSSVIAGETTGTHTTSATVGKLLDTTTDALLDIGTQKYFYTDAYRYGIPTSPHTTDVVLFGEPTVESSTDTYFETRTDHTTDTLIVAVRGATGTTDTNLINDIDVYHDVDVSVWSMVDMPHDTDALQYRLVDLTYTGDSALLGQGDITHTANFLKIGSPSVVHTANALKKLEITDTSTTDAVKSARVDLTHSTSAIKQGEGTSIHTANSNLGLTNIVTRFHTTVSTLKTSYSDDFDTDSFIKKTYSESSTGNSILEGEASKLFATNARIVIPTASFSLHTGSSSIDGEVDRTHTANSLLRQLMEHDSDTDAFLHYSGDLAHTASSVKARLSTLTHSGSSHLHVQNDQAHTTEAYKYIQPSLTHSTSAVTFGIVSATHTASSILFGETTVSHGTLALLRKDITDSSDTNAALAFDVIHTANTLVALAAQQEQALASSLFGTTGNTHTATALIFILTGFTHTTSSSLLGEVTAYHITNAIRFGEANNDHNTNTLLATESVHTTSSILAGESGSTHSTSSMLKNDDVGIFEQDQTDIFEGAF